MEFVVYAVQRGIINQLHLQQPLLSGKGLDGETGVNSVCGFSHDRRFFSSFIFNEQTVGSGQKGTAMPPGAAYRGGRGSGRSWAGRRQFLVTAMGSWGIHRDRGMIKEQLRSTVIHLGTGSGFPFGAGEITVGTFFIDAESIPEKCWGGWVCGGRGCRYIYRGKTNLSCNCLWETIT